MIDSGRTCATIAEGELRTGSGQPVTSGTLFKIASNTKAMTTALLARLVDQGRLRWDDPVTRHLPGFRMHDPWVTREIQVRDLLIHNSGLGAGAGDLMLWPEPNHFTREDVVAGLAHLRPVDSFRSRYAYDNTLYIVAGEVAAAAASVDSYEALLRRELFEPLGMDGCRVGEWRRDAVPAGVAQPHIRIDGRNIVVREDGETVAAVPMAAAGGVRCSLDDMLHWVRMWLQPERHGLVDGKPWLSREQREALWTAHTPMPLGRRLRDWEGARFYAYGYGWRLNDSDGALKVSHTGTLSGMYSAVVLFPELDAGFVVMMNGGGTDARSALVQTLSRLIVAPQQAPSLEHYAALLEQEAAQRRDDPQASAPDTSDRAPVAPSELADRLGRYRDPWFGEISVCAADGRVRFASTKSPMLTGTVMRTGGRLLVDWDDASVDAEAWLDFAANGDDTGPDLAMSKVDPEADFSYDYEDLAFARTAPCP